MNIISKYLHGLKLAEEQKDFAEGYGWAAIRILHYGFNPKFAVARIVELSDKYHEGMNKAVADIGKLTAPAPAPAQPPNTININGHFVPKPIRKPLVIGAPYWVVTPTGVSLSATTAWSNSGLDKEWLARGLVHLTQEHADLNAKAMLSLTSLTEWKDDVSC